MRFGLVLLFCLACLALTSEAAPASAKAPMQRGSYNSPTRHQHGKDSDHARKAKRQVTENEIQAADQAAAHLVPQPHLLSAYRDKYTSAEEARRSALKLKLHQMQVEDSIHTAKYGKTPPKFPAITRIAGTIGLTSAELNVFNFLFSAKTTALATDGFSSAPTPPTLIDTAARWDGKKYDLLPVPKDDPDGAKRKRDLGPQLQVQKRGLSSRPEREDVMRMAKRRKAHPVHEEFTSVRAQDAKVEKRWIVSSLVGAGLGAALSPGVPSAIMGKKEEVEKPPFDPYDPNMLKPKDDFVAAAATADQPLPAVQSTQPSVGSTVPLSSDVGRIVFPEDASHSPLLDQRYPTTEGSSPYRGFDTDSTSPVLRKRSTHPTSETKAYHGVTDLKKRFLFMGGPWSKIAGAITVGSVVPLIYSGVTHARDRTFNPRDRDILKDLDDTPTYGAVGVPGRQPGQLATNAMPGYSDYITRLEKQQSQPSVQAQQAEKLPNLKGGQEVKTVVFPSGDDTSGGGDAAPVLRRREKQHSVEKRGNLLAGGALAAFGLALGYAQSATQFPTDRDEEKDEKKRKIKKAQEAMMAQQQQQAMMQGSGGGSGVDSADPLAGIPTRPLPGSDDAAGSQSDPLAGVPVKPLPYSGGAYVGSGSTSLYASGGGDGSGRAFSLSDSLNAAAGYQQPSNQDGSNVLKKRDLPVSSNNEVLAKRAPGIGNALTIGGTTMFVGTLAGNLFVSHKQKSKPVPVVTPNADTRGPMIPGGELYTAYLESKRGQTDSAGPARLGGAGTGMPADLNRGAVAPAPSLSSNAGSVYTPVFPEGPSQGTSDDQGGDPILKKRSVLVKRTPLAFAAAAAEAGEAGALLSKAPALLEAEAGLASTLGRGAAAEAGAGELSALGRGAAASEAGAGAVSASRAGAGRLAGYSGEARTLGQASESGLTGLGRAASSESTLAGLGREGALATTVYRPNAAAWGSAKPAMVGEAGAGAGAATQGVPATLESTQVDSKKGMTWMKGIGIVSAGAGASMMFNGVG